MPAIPDSITSDLIERNSFGFWLTVGNLIKRIGLSENEWIELRSDWVLTNKTHQWSDVNLQLLFRRYDGAGMVKSGAEAAVEKWPPSLGRRSVFCSNTKLWFGWSPNMRLTVNRPTDKPNGQTQLPFLRLRRGYSTLRAILMPPTRGSHGRAMQNNRRLNYPRILRPCVCGRVRAGVYVRGCMRVCVRGYMRARLPFRGGLN